MMNKLSIKKKLLIYVFFIQLSILVIFSFSLHRALEISTLDKLQSTLKVILLDVIDDILEQKDINDLKDFNEEKEYKFEPLYIRLLQVQAKEKNTINIINTKNFPKEIKEDFEIINSYAFDTIIFENKELYLISKLKFNLGNTNYLLEVATNNNLNSTLENLLYILLFIIPIVLIFATIGGYSLIYRSFLPIEKILNHLKNINASDLSKRLETSNNEDEIDLLAKEINSLLTRLELSFEKISQFSSDASHELKTPLTVIRGEIEIALRKERSKEEYKETLKTSLDEVLVIQQTMDDLLFLAKSKKNLQNIEKEVYLDEITLEAGKELETFARIKKINIEYEIKEAQQISAHSKLLKIALKNIIKNAITFSHENSSIYIKNYSDEDYYLISVEDKGIGIAKEDQDKIFEQFYRTDKSRNKETGGTGLGMAICKKIINMHNGKVLVQSKENMGTIIIFSFPKNY